MAATDKQVDVYVYYISNYQLKYARVARTETTIDSTQSDKYYITGEPDGKSFTETEIFEDVADFKTYLADLADAL